ncbi:MAG: hypothetical protein FWG90_09300 [Oscillospiraceae bacterium]|nr:hypothetical protein [Oscillospiraceae bacterium]
MKKLFALMIIAAVLLSACNKNINNSGNEFEETTAVTTTTAETTTQTTSATTEPVTVTVTAETEKSVEYITIKGEKYSTDLRRLDLSGKGLTDDDIKELGEMKRLTWLNLSDNFITDSSLVSKDGFNDWVFYPGHLNLSNNQITDISMFKDFSYGNVLFLDGNPVTDMEYDDFGFLFSSYTIDYPAGDWKKAYTEYANGFMDYYDDGYNSKRILVEDLNGDGIPELLLQVNYMGGQGRLLTFKDNKLQILSFCFPPNMVSTWQGYFEDTDNLFIMPRMQGSSTDFGICYSFLDWTDEGYKETSHIDIHIWNEYADDNNEHTEHYYIGEEETDEEEYNRIRDEMDGIEKQTSNLFSYDRFTELDEIGDISAYIENY